MEHCSPPGRELTNDEASAANGGYIEPTLDGSPDTQPDTSTGGGQPADWATP